MKRNRDIWKGFVAIEGIDGAGTTTLTRNLKDSLSQNGHETVAGFEPTDGSIGSLVRRGLSGEEPVEPETLALLFAADRREHLYGNGGIRQHLQNDRIYITDRYLFSSMAYQTLDCPWEWIAFLNEDYPLPSHLVFLGLPVDIAMSRLSVRENKDIYETNSLQERVAASYKRALGEFQDSGMKILELDSRRSPEEVCRDAALFLSDVAF